MHVLLLGTQKSDVLPFNEVQFSHYEEVLLYFIPIEHYVQFVALLQKRPSEQFLQFL